MTLSFKIVERITQANEVGQLQFVVCHSFP